MLTEREKDVLKLVMEGMTNKEIADVLSISFHTVKAHLEHIYDKTNIHSRIELTVNELLHRTNYRD